MPPIVQNGLVAAYHRCDSSFPGGRDMLLPAVIVIVKNNKTKDDDRLCKELEKVTLTVLCY